METAIDRLNDGIGDPGGLIDEIGGTKALLLVVAAAAYWLFGRGS